MNCISYIILSICFIVFASKCIRFDFIFDIDVFFTMFNIISILIKFTVFLLVTFFIPRFIRISFLFYFSHLICHSISPIFTHSHSISQIRIRIFRIRISVDHNNTLIVHFQLIVRR
uniref:Uncharacterized protein n=1 Tax=Cacopsylla melanoneura TaxID=428564 RepID=A0A8D9AP18_9HEMI